MKQLGVLSAVLAFLATAVFTSGCTRDPVRDPRRVVLNEGSASFVPPRGFLEASADDFSRMKKQMSASSAGGIHPNPLYLCRTNGALFAVSVLAFTNNWLPSLESVDRYMGDFKNYLGRKGEVYATNSQDRGMVRKILFLSGSDFDVYKCVLWGKSKGGRSLETAVEIDSMVPKGLKSEDLHREVVAALNSLRIE